jgi:hypothetical protein
MASSTVVCVTLAKFDRQWRLLLETANNGISRCTDLQTWGRTLVFILFCGVLKAFGLRVSFKVGVSCHSRWG